MADFLVALADFDRRRDWEVLGHSSLFAFLHVELKLPNPSAFWRMSAARLLQRFPDLAAPLRDGRLCCTATAELAKVLTEQNRSEVLPRFFGLSSREAQEVVAELQPRQAPATRTVVTAPARVATAPALALSTTSLAFGDAPLATAEAAAPGMHPNVVPLSQLRAPEVAFGGGVRSATLRDDVEPLETAEAAAPGMHPNMVPLSQLRAPEVAFGGGVRTATLRDDVEPLTADLRRLHITVDARFLKMLATARDGLSHTIPGASAEQVLRAALELLLEKQARARGLVKRPRTVVATATATPPPSATATPTPMTPAPGAASATAAAPARAASPVSAATSAPETASAPAPASAPATALATTPDPTSAPVPASASAPVPIPGTLPVSAALPAPAPATVPGLITATATATILSPAIATATAEDASETPPLDFAPPLHRRTGARQHVPAAISRAVWQRDGGRCAWPLDGGGVCGSTHRLELDHVIPWARWGGETVNDLRIACHAHNALAARQAFGERCAARYAGPGPGAGRLGPPQRGAARGPRRGHRSAT